MNDLPADDSSQPCHRVRRCATTKRATAPAALEAGGTAFPQPVKDAMTLVSGVMTATAYRV
jgi:ubiquinone biosynthesis monooxygenase Coq7